MTEAALKSGWTKVKFGEVVRLCKDRSSDPEADGIERYVGLEHLEPEDLRIRSWGLVADGTTFTSRFKPGQVLFGKRRAYQRKVAVADFEGVCSGDIYVFESADQKHLLPELLPFICQTESFFRYAVGTSMGSLSPRTNWKHLKELDLLLPSIDSQRKFVRVLRSIESSRESLLQLTDKSNKLYESYILEALCTLSDQFSNVCLEEVAQVQYGLTVNKKRRTSETQVPYLRVANVQRDELDLSEVKTIGTLFGDETYTLQKGDVLVVEGHADPNEVGRSALWPYENIEMLHQNHLIRIRANEKLLPNYLSAFINSPLGRRYFRTYAKSTSGLNTLNSTVVRQLELPFPPVDKQEKIVQHRRIFRDEIGKIQQRFKHLNSIRRSCLEQLEGT